MKILITGAAGFIGYNFCYYLLKKTNYKIYGIDNINNYYDVKIKKDRLKNLKKFKNFKFKKMDILKNSLLEKIFKKEKFDFVFNFAAQAGVRYSIKYPRKYIDANNQMSFRWNDPKIKIKWPIKKPILSNRDKKSKLL